MRGVLKKTGVLVLTMILALSGVFAQNVGFMGGPAEVYAAQKLVYLNKSFVNIVPGDAFKLNLYSGKKNISKKAKWSTSKSSVVTVNKKGRIKAKNTGKAVITAAYGDKSVKCAVTSAYKDYEELYHDTLNAMYNRIYGWSVDSDALAGGFVGIAEAIGSDTGDAALRKIGYSIMDINGDGVPELIVSGITKRGKNCFADDISLLYTYVDKKSVEVTSGWARNRYTMMDNGSLYYMGSSGAAYSYFGEFTLVPGETQLTCKDLYFSTDEDPEDDHLDYHHNTVGYGDVSVSEKLSITPDEFWDINRGYESRSHRIEVTPFSDFPVDIFSSASEDIAIYENTAGYEEFYEFSASDSEYRLTTVIAANSAVSDFKVYKLTWKDSGANMLVPELSAEPLYTLEKLTPDKPLKLTIVFMGDMPEYAITFKDKNGEDKSYALEQSGMDGSILLSEL